MARLAARPRKRRRKAAGDKAKPSSPHAPPALRLFAEMRAAGLDPARAPEAAIKDYVLSRLGYDDPALRPRNRSKRQRHEAWMREKE